MKQTRILFLALSLIFISCDRDARDDKDRTPNILFILADDLGNHDLSFTGSNYYETPNIDRIAGEGMYFANGYAGCQVCSPSRASIMSGKFPARHGVTDWIGARSGVEWRKVGRASKLLPPQYRHQLPQEYTVLPEAMKQAGYKTFFAGKWHLGGEGSYPEDHGFDVNIGGYHAGGPYSGGYFSPFNNPKMEDREDEKGMQLSAKLANETVRFIREHKDSAFFAFLSFYAVHAPVETSQEKWSKYRQKAEEMGIGETGFKMGKYLPMRQAQDHPVYAGLVESMDDAVGIVLSALDEMGLADNTIVIFTSDNGGVSAGDAFATSNLPLRGGKGYQFEGGLRVPYFIKVPWLDIAGRKSTVPVTGTDFYPTLLDLIGETPKPAEHQDGKSLVPLLTGSDMEARPFIWHYPHYGNQGGDPSSVIRLGEWKLIHYYEDDRKELFNLDKDPAETRDVSGDHVALVDQLSRQLFGYLKEVDAQFPEHDPQYDAALEKAYLGKIETERLPQLEEQRRKFLSKDFDPGNDWWGSGAGQEP